MAFQVSEYEYRELLKKLMTADPLKKGSENPSEWIERIEQDPKLRMKMKAVILVATRQHEIGSDPLQVKRVICWRNAKGEPGDIEAEFHQHRQR